MDTKRLIVVLLITVLVFSGLWFLYGGALHDKDGSQQAPEQQEIKQQEELPAVPDGEETTGKSPALSDSEKSDEVTSDIQKKKKLSAEELEQLKLTDYHAYVRYKAQPSDTQDDLPEDPDLRKQELQQRIRKKLRQHLEHKKSLQDS